VTDLGETNPEDGGSDTPPKRNWEATRKERFFDLKFSHYVEIILTFALVGIAYFQYTVYERQAVIMDLQTKILAIAQRSFITVSQLERSEQKTQDGGFAGWIFEPAIKNTGSTMTHGMKFVEITPMNWSRFADQNSTADMEIWLANQIGSPPDPEDAFVAKRSSVLLPTVRTAILGPNSTLPPRDFLQAAQNVIAPVILDGIERNNSMRFFYGAIRYGDQISKADDVHITKYCFAITPLITPQSKTPTVSLCRHWNCADSECENDKKNYDEARKAASADPARPRQLQTLRNYPMPK
jgi:hypothetical protein